jgi:Mg2+/citrate symporter
LSLHLAHTGRSRLLLAAVDLAGRRTCRQLLPVPLLLPIPRRLGFTRCTRLLMLLLLPAAMSC